MKFTQHIIENIEILENGKAEVSFQDGGSIKVSKKVAICIQRKQGLVLGRSFGRIKKIFRGYMLQ